MVSALSLTVALIGAAGAACPDAGVFAALSGDADNFGTLYIAGAAGGYDGCNRAGSIAAEADTGMLAVRPEVLMFRRGTADGIRPRLQFWLDRTALEQFLAEGRPAPPDLIESDGTASQAMALPVVETRQLDLDLRSVTLARVLMPVDAIAAADWLRQQDEGARLVPPLLILDVSGSAEPLLRNLLTLVERQSGPELAGADVSLVMVWSAESASRPSGRRFGEIADLEFDPPSDGDELPLDEALAPGDVPAAAVLALLGGDIALPATSMAPDASTVMVAQITPELDPELAASLADQAVRFLPYSTAQPKQLVAWIASSGAFVDQRALLEERRRQFSQAQRAAGYPPVEPGGAAANAALQRVPESGWLAVPVWTVVNPVLLDLSPL